jgi:hypothetical protein
MEPQRRQTLALPTNRAFVVQFRAEADVTQGRFEGRVEHVVSGQAVNFHRLEELEAFLIQVMRAVQEGI